MLIGKVRERARQTVIFFWIKLPTVDLSIATSEAAIARIPPSPATLTAGGRVAGRPIFKVLENHHLKNVGPTGARPLKDLNLRPSAPRARDASRPPRARAPHNKIPAVDRPRAPRRSRTVVRKSADRLKLARKLLRNVGLRAVLPLGTGWPSRGT